MKRQILILQALHVAVAADAQAGAVTTTGLSHCLKVLKVVLVQLSEPSLCSLCHLYQ